MYESYWGLSRRPFADDGDEVLFRSQTHQAALLKLRYTIETGQAAGLLVGEAGSGKSSLVGALKRELDCSSSPFLQLRFAQLSATEFLCWLAAALSGSEAPQGGLDRVLRKIETELARLADQQCRPVLVIDDAHLVRDAALFPTLHQLLSYPFHGTSPFTLFLVGEPELVGLVSRCVPLNERFAVRCGLQSLSREETAEYVSHRLRCAGADQPIFEPAALEAVFEFSAGLPRRINRLCDLALLVGFADRLKSVSRCEVEAVAEELTSLAAA